MDTLKLKANNYDGNYNNAIDTFTVSGTFNVSREKQLTGLHGSVKENELVICNFDAWSNGEKMNYNFNGISDLERLASASAAIYSTETDIKTNLKNGNYEIV